MSITVKYSLLPGLERTEIFDQEFLFHINVIEGIHPFKCILGRKDIFRVAKITFEGYKKQFQLDFRKLN